MRRVHIISNVQSGGNDMTNAYVGKGKQVTDRGSRVVKMTRQEAINSLAHAKKMLNLTLDPQTGSFYKNKVIELENFIISIDAAENTVDTTYEEVPDREGSKEGRKAITKREGR